MRYFEQNDIKDLKGEIWMEVENFCNYKISNLGRLKNIKTNKICKLQKTDKDYLFYKLEGACKKVKIRIHKLVANAFLNNPNNYEIINHKNGDKLDNSVDNLEWIGDLKYVGKKVLQFNLNGKFLKDYQSLKEAAVENGLSKCGISNVCNGKMGSCGGFKWEYAREAE